MIVGECDINVLYTHRYAQQHKMIGTIASKHFTLKC